jgi:DNA-binding GntR family transcriptional regulator
MDKRLIPGTMLNRRDVAKELGVSVAPVLEAMLQLEMEGFLESVPRKGSFIKAIRLEDVYGQLMVREALECQAARLYCGKPLSAGKAALMDTAGKLDTLSGGSIKQWEGEIQFHLSLIETAKCVPLSQAYIRTMRLGLFYQLNQIVNIRSQPEDKHTSLVEALCSASPGQAEGLIRRHVRSGKDHLLDVKR